MTSTRVAVCVTTIMGGAILFLLVFLRLDPRRPRSSRERACLIAHELAPQVSDESSRRRALHSFIERYACAGYFEHLIVADACPDVLVSDLNQFRDHNEWCPSLATIFREVPRDHSVSSGSAWRLEAGRAAPAGPSRTSAPPTGRR